jgi:putative phosphoribosyl transferase
MGAIANGGVQVLNDDVIGRLNVPRHAIDRAAAIAQRELERREFLYRGDRPSPDLKDRIVILIDDGLATGSTMRAAAQAVRQHHPARLVVAVATAAVETCEEFRSEVEEVICAVTPAPFYAVGLWYEEFSQTSDEEVRDLLARAHPVAVPSGSRWERQ